MNKFIATMAAVSAVAIAAPAFAQPGYGGQPYGQRNDYRGGASADMNLSARIDQLQMRLQAGIQSGSIDRREAMGLRQQLRQLTQLQRQYARNGISGQERGELQRRMRDLRMAIRSADGNDRARWDSYDREDGYGRDGRWSDAGDMRYPQEQPRSGLGGVIDSVMGRDGLRVGQQASSGLYGLQGGYRDQYRDGDGSYYRTDGRRIYQIDARSQAVVRIYPMGR